MTLKTLKQHSALTPLFVFLGMGAGMAALYLARLGLKAPDVSFAHHKNPEHWNKLPPTYQIKLLAPRTDYSKLTKPSDRPDI